MSAAASQASRRTSRPLADQPTETLSREQLAAAIRPSPAHPLVAQKYLDQARGDHRLARALALADDPDPELNLLGRVGWQQWLTRRTLTAPDQLGAYGPERFRVAYRRRDGSLSEHSVSYEGRAEGNGNGNEGEQYRCDCEAYMRHGYPCRHVGAVYEYVRQIRQAFTPEAARTQLRYEMTCEDIERAEGMKAAFALATGATGARTASGRGGSAYRADESAW